MTGPTPPRLVGVISDTHGLLRPEALGALEGCELILHAGDVGDRAILERLGEIAPVHAVLGNTDRPDLLPGVPASALVDLGTADGVFRRDGPVGPVAYVLHIAEAMDLDPAAAGVDLVVTGHTHQPAVERRGGVLHLNPGSAGPRRFSLPVTLARLRVEGGEVDVEVVELVHTAP